MAIDVCVVSSLQGQTVDKAAAEPGAALKHRFQQKWDKYGEACIAEGLFFQPLPIKVLGGIHESALLVINNIKCL